MHSKIFEIFQERCLLQNSNFLQSRILWLEHTCCIRPATPWKHHGSHSKWRYLRFFSQPPSSLCLQNDYPWRFPSSCGTTKSYMEQGLVCMGGEGQFWCPSLSIQNFIASQTSKLSSHYDCILQTSHLWQTLYSRVCSMCSYTYLLQSRITSYWVSLVDV